MEWIERKILLLCIYLIVVITIIMTYITTLFNGNKIDKVKKQNPKLKNQ